MRFIIWGINFAPETVGIGPFNTLLADYLSSQGHEVEIVTSFPYYPHWQKSAQDRSTWYRRESRGSVVVHRCWHYVPGKVTSFKRILHEGSFVCLSVLRVLTLRRPDLLVVVSPPLLSGAFAAIVGLLKRIPYTFHVQDMQPDAAMGLGMLKPGIFANILYRLEAIAYHFASLVTTISEPMVESIRLKGVPARKVRLFPNGVDLSRCHPSEKRGAFRSRLKIDPKTFLLVYSGNIGLKQGLTQVFAAARLLRGIDFLLVIAGDGAGRANLEKQVEREQLSNLRLLPLQSEAHYFEMLNDADLCLIVQEHGTGRFFLPSKLLKILALARPVLAVADEGSPLIRLLQEGGFGVWSPTDQPELLAQKIQQFLAQPLERAQAGEAGRRFVEKFSLERVLPEYEKALLEVIVSTRCGVEKGLGLSSAG